MTRYEQLKDVKYRIMLAKFQFLSKVNLFVVLEGNRPAHTKCSLKLTDRAITNKMRFPVISGQSVCLYRR